MGKKDPCTVFGCNNDRLFPEKYTVKALLSHCNLILRKLQEKMSRKALKNKNEMCLCPLGIL